MKEKLPWTTEEQGCLIKFAEELADCGDLLHLDELTGADDIYELADRVSTLLGCGQPLAVNHPVMETEAEPMDVSRTGAVLADLLAGYTDCMDEAIRYLVEEEKYSMDHPVVQGLRQHLLAQQDRFLLEAVRSQHNNNVNNNSTNPTNNSAAADARSKIALLVETFCNTRPPSG